MWFFKKKKEPDFNYQRELAFIQANLHDSFSKIKQDMKIMKDWISHLNDRDNERVKAIDQMGSRVDELGETLSYVNLAQEQMQIAEKSGPSRVIEELEDAPVPSFDVLDSLTDTQQAMFQRVGLLLNETGQDWLAIKTLASELYPNKVYDQVRSTTSEYVGILVDSGLLEKRRRGKQTYVSLTKNGEQFFKKVKGSTLTKEVRED